MDRGLGGATHISASNFSLNITILFFGGHNDYEAIAFNLQMAE